MPRVIYQGQPTASYTMRVVLDVDEEDPKRQILFVESLRKDAMGNESWHEVEAAVPRRNALEAAVFSLLSERQSNR